MMVPFMACGARLAVFVLLGNVFFEDNSALLVFSLYLVGILVALFTSIVFNALISKKKKEVIIPQARRSKPLRWPHCLDLVQTSVNKTWYFITSSGKMLLILFAGIYLLNTTTGDSLSVPAKDGVLVRAGKFISPIFKPIGVDEDNWPAAVAILTGSIAKESVVGSIKAIYGEGEAGAAEMRTKFNGKLGAFSYLLFIMLSFPCASVFFSIAKQLSYSWAFISVLWSTFMAYAVSAGCYQLGMMVGADFISLLAALIGLAFASLYRFRKL
jgi:ferrous iron transport protein B